MKRFLFLSALATTLMTAPLHAACYADYKAKKDNPLRLHYGVIELPESACRNRGQAAAIVGNRIARGGWALLNVMTVFGPEGLNEDRRESAGEFFLRF